MRGSRAARESPSRRGAAAATTQVVCFGEVLWDFFERSSPKRGSTRAEEPIAREFARELGGAPANVATGLARLGVASAIVGGIGLDSFGEALDHHLSGDGVDTKFLVRMANRTGITFVTRDVEGEPSFLFYRHETADVSLRPEHITREMVSAAWVLVGSSTMMTPTLAAATERFLTLAEETGARIVVDLNVREHLWPSKAQMRDAVARLVKRAAIVKGSFADLVALTGRRDILWLADNAPRAAWLVTQGAKGASAIGDHGFIARPARTAKCVDATGAGDAFIAGALSVLIEAGATPGTAAWRDERVWGAALEAGHVMGAKAVSGVGSVKGLVDLSEVRAIARSVRRLVSREEVAPKGKGTGARRPARATSTGSARRAVKAKRAK